MTSDRTPIIYWFRQDLRLHDLPALSAALASGRPVLACYILDDESPGRWQLGAASRWWLHHSLNALAGDIAACGGQLYLAQGRPDKVLAALAASSGADRVCCSRQYEPWARALEEHLHAVLSKDGIELKRYPGSLLWEPEAVKNKAGAAFKVFTPFWRKCRSLPVATLAQSTTKFSQWPKVGPPSALLKDLQLQPTKPNWALHWEQNWQPGERAAVDTLAAFLKNDIGDYAEGRDFPARNTTSRLSPHLHFGEISPATVFRAAEEAALLNPELQEKLGKFLSELGWREFSYHLLFHFPELPEQAFKANFSHFPWVGGADALEAWQRGETGYPLVDAGMKELWHTGYMHNRVRMVAASFLCKHLLVDWRAGQRWFWDTLVDADLASNACGWQWVAGSGADASPYFRIFNPTTQAQKFDGEGEYIRQWLPSLSALPDKYLHQPWTAPAEVLQASGVTLGETYPQPIVDHRDARNAALDAYADSKTHSSTKSE